MSSHPSRANSPDLEISEDESLYVDAEKLPISFLAQMITPYNGSSAELQNFLQNAENAFSLAHDTQKRALTALIFSKVSAEVKNKLNATNITTFANLKQKLEQIFQITESFTLLQEQLETCKQKQNESIKEFYSRIERLNSRIIQKVKENTTSKSMLIGKLALVEDMALRRFTHHCKPEISNILRHKNCNSMNEALSIASEEEAFISMQNQLRNASLNNNNSNNSRKYCKICRKNNHNTKDCRNKNNSSQFNNSTNGETSRSDHRNNYFKQCIYCKFKGHTIDECRKKRFNENLNNSNPKVADANSGINISNNSNQLNTSNNDVNHLNYKSLGLTEAKSTTTSKSTEWASLNFQMQ